MYILEGIGMENVGQFYGHLVYTIFYIFSPKNWQTKWTFFAQTTANYCKKDQNISF
jgi:hypothetical protein